MSEPKGEPDTIPLPFDPLTQATCPRCDATISRLPNGDLLCENGHLFLPQKPNNKGLVNKGRTT